VEIEVDLDFPEGNCKIHIYLFCGKKHVDKLHNVAVSTELMADARDFFKGSWYWSLLASKWTASCWTVFVSTEVPSRAIKHW
jgi:hypothetical protein